MAKQDFKVDGGLVVSEGITVTGGTVDFSGASGGGQSLYDLSNVNSSSSPTNGQALVWDNTNSYWTPATVAGSGGIALSDLSVTQASASGTGTLAYNNVSGGFTYTPPDLSGYAALTDLSVATATGSGSGSLAYNNATGVFTFTPPNLSTYLTESSLTGSDLDMNGNKVLFGNLYSAESDLPSASSYHGMFAHVHATGKGYFAHAGSWHKLLDETSSTTDHLSEGGTNLYYTEERVDDRVNTLIQAGSNITITYNDPGNQLTIAAAGGVIALSDLSVITATASGGGSLAFSDTTGVFTFTPPDLSAKVELDDLSIATAANSASGSLAYNNVTGVFTFTPPDLTSYVTSVTVDSITDTNITSVANNEFLVYDSASSKWTNQTAAEAGLATVATSGQYSDLLNRIEDTDDLTEGSTNLYYTDARVDSRLSGGSVATVTTTGNVTVGGNLTVSGTTTTVNTETINLADNTITLNSNFAGSSPTEDGGIEIERGTQTNKTLVWNETSDKWTVGSETFVAGTFEGALTGNVTGNVTGTVSDITNHSLYSLSNVFTSSAPSDGQVLTWDNSNSYWKPTTVTSGGGGSTTFVGLTDTPSAFTGAGGRLVKVNSGATALEFVTDDKIALTDLSVITASAGTSALSYNNSSGVLTFTPPDLSSYLTEISGDTTPQLGGMLDVNGNALGDGVLELLKFSETASAINEFTIANAATGGNPVLSATGDDTNIGITLTPKGTGDITLGTLVFDGDQTVGSGQDDYVLTYDHSAGTIGLEAAAGGSSIAYLESNVTTAPTGTLSTGTLTLGGSARHGGTLNTNLGNFAGSSETTGTNHIRSIAIGHSARYYGDDNVVIGNAARANNSSGQGVVIGGSNGTFARAGNKGIAIGYQAQSTSAGAVAIGANTVSSGTGSVTVGENTDATNQYSMAIGQGAQATANAAVAIGADASTATANQLMLGKNDTTKGFTSIRVGNTSYAPSDNLDLATKGYVDSNAGIALSDLSVATASASGSGSLAYNNSTGVFTFTPAASSGGSINYISSTLTGNATASGTGALAIGSGSTASSINYSLAIGTNANTTGNNAIAIGSGASNDKTEASGGASIAIGHGADATGDGTVVVGHNASTTGNYGVAFGQQSTAAVLATALGYQTSATASYSTAIGYSASTSTANQLMLGDATSSYGYTSIRVGNTSYSPSDNYDLATKKYVDDNAGGSGGLGNYGAVNSTGTAASATGTDAIAIGESASAPIQDAVCIGNGASATANLGYSAVSIGLNASVTSYQGIALGENSVGSAYCVAIGSYTDATANYAMAIGNNAQATATDTIVIGRAASANSAGNIVIGKSAGSTGARNLIINNHGYATGSYNTLVGANLNSSTHRIYAAGSYNTCLGYYTQPIGSGGYNTHVGYAAGNTNYKSNVSCFGYLAQSNVTNSVTLGNTSVSSLRCATTSITSISDERDKTQVETLDVGLDYVNAVEPKVFYKNPRGAYYSEVYTNEQLAADESLTQSYTFDQASYDAGTQKTDMREFGWIAQQVETALPSQYQDTRLTVDEVDPVHGYDVKRFNGADMMPILWKALQQLSDKHDQLQTDYDALLARVVALENA